MFRTQQLLRWITRLINSTLNVMLGLLASNPMQLSSAQIVWNGSWMAKMLSHHVNLRQQLALQQLPHPALHVNVSRNHLKVGRHD